MKYIDSKKICFQEIKNDKIYEMREGGRDGNRLYIDGTYVGSTIFSISKNIINISTFGIIRSYRRKGHGTIFYNLLIFHVKALYGVTRVVARELTDLGNKFFKSVGLKYDDGKKYPDYRYGPV